MASSSVNADESQARVMESDSEVEVVACEEGGWADGSSEDEYDSDEPIPLVPKLEAPRARPESPAADRDRLWVEDVAFQVGNAAHEIRNALRFWASLVTDPQKQAKASLQLFKKADNIAGKLEATMRALVGRARNSPQLWRPVSRLVPKAQGLLASVQADLAPLSDAGGVPEEQRRAVQQLVSRQEAYLAALAEALDVGYVPETAPALPPPGKRVDFDAWRDQENRFVAEVEQNVVAQQTIPLEQIIGLARLTCNSSHQLQNLASAPRGGLGSQAHKILKLIDNKAGKCENASRSSMVLAHRAHQLQNAKPTAKISEHALFLQEAAEKCAKLAEKAVSVEGGDTVPAEAYKVVLERLARLAAILHASVPAEHRRLTRERKARSAGKGAGKGKAASAIGSRCAGCGFAVTGIAPAHCCRRCAKTNGQHGPACKQQVVAVA